MSRDEAHQLLAARVGDLAPKLRSFMRARVRCRATADDLAQDTLVKAWRNVAMLRDESRLEAWLYRTARRVLIDHYRKHPARVTSAVGEIAAEPARPAAAEVSDCVARAARCYLGTLPATYQDAVRLADEEGLDHAEVARRLGISLTAAKSRIRRGKQLVRAKLEACCALEFDHAGRVVDYTVRRPCGCR